VNGAGGIGVKGANYEIVCPLARNRYLGNLKQDPIISDPVV
jgi:hypothetical protein